MNYITNITTTEEVRSLKDILIFIRSEFKPKGKILTPFNLISAPVILLGSVLILYRFFMGLGSVANSSSEYPWGIWIGFIVLVGVAFAGGAYVTAFVVYILRAERYHSIVRMAVLNGFLAYVFYAGAILLDLGRWWNIVNPIIGNRLGVNSVLFLVAWHFLLYMIAQLVEISPAFAEWLGLKKARRFLSSLTLGAVIAGVTLSTLHQSGLGALFLMAKWKIHPLWYTEFIPLLFFVSSIFAGLSVVIFIGTVSYRVFDKDRIDEEYRKSWDDIVVDLGKACSITMFVYFFLQFLVLIHSKNWALLNTAMGYWYLAEVIGLVLIPCFLFSWGVKYRSLTPIKTAAVITMIGVIINRINYSIIAYKWYLPLSERYIPSWIEVIITMAIVFTMIWVFRWIVNRTPILLKPPAWAIEQEREEEIRERIIAVAPQLGLTMADGGKLIDKK
ncbi:MAG TPA: NrfD/PsrC family molybdoenzyme membrane anchor subunit [Syntrophales bacterium]|nr:NrfD/PsrC family molybdoenzyme membrane anchor subunit [Syntrophales bacterium]